MVNYRNKAENRFKFIPFSERISSINVDVFHRVAHRNEESEEEKKTFLQESFEKWTVLNRSKEWVDFYKLIVQHGIRTLPQVLNQKEYIAGVFIKYIPLQSEFSLQPVLELLTAFVKDLRQEFYSYYPAILKQLVKLLKTKNPEAIEQAFVCLAYIFKYLVRSLVKDLDVVLVDLAPLLEDSQPEYIREFAAESFSFVARRVKDKNKFLTLVLATTQSHPQLTAGCGRLVMETMYGIRGQLHSSANEMLNTLFSSFGNPEIPQNLLFTLNQYVVQSYVTRINAQHSTICSVIVAILKERVRDTEVSYSEKPIKALLNILLEILDYKGGIHLRDSKSLAELLISLCVLPNVSIEVRELLSKSVVQLLTAPAVKLPQEFASGLASIMFQQPKEILFDFVVAACNYGGFEAIILRSVLDLNVPIDTAYITTLAKIVANKTTSNNEWIQYPLKFKNTKTPEEILNLISYDNEGLAAYVYMIPHITSINIQKSCEKLTDLANIIIKKLDERRNNLYLLYLTIESLINLKSDTPVILNISELFSTLLPLASKSFLAFRILEFLLKLINKSELSLEHMSALKQAAIARLTSQFRNVRASALRVLIDLEKDALFKALLERCLVAESVPLSVLRYREATVQIRELHFEKLNVDESNVEIIFKFLLGYLFSNFALVENDIIQAIQSFDEANYTSVWNNLKNQLVINNEDVEDIDQLDIPSFLQATVIAIIGSKEHLPLDIYKERIWKALQNFTLKENFEKDIIDITIQHAVKKELSPAWKQSCDIRYENTGDDSLIIADEKEEAPSNYKSKKKIICYQLNIVSKTRSHCTLKYRMQEIKNICMNLLLDGEISVRKSAIECLVTQTPKSLSPYKEHLINLIDDDGFKGAIVHFQLDKETGEVKENHRPIVMPIVLRLLYSKMITSGPTQRGNKSSAAAYRRKQVMKFLSACQEKEVQGFLTMAFRVFNIDPEENESSSKIVDEMFNVSLDRIIHPRKLQSAVNLASIMLEHLGGYLSVSLQKFILQVLLSISATVSRVLESREDVMSGFLPLFKKIRIACLLALTVFFNKFVKFPWTEDDIDAFFRATIWPIVEKLAIEGIHSPTAVLKLFTVWSENPRYFCLLSRHQKDDVNKTPLTYIMELLLVDHSHHSVSSSITSLLERLLTLREDDAMETEETPPPPIDVQFIRPIDNDALNQLKVSEELNYGSKILMPHVAGILEMLRRQLARSQKKCLGKTETTVLARITELATSAEHADSLVGLLLKVLSVRPSSDEEVLVNSVQTIKNLISIVSKPLNYLRTLALLFGNVEIVQGRKVLITCLEELAERCPEISEMAAIVRDLNAYDRRWIDQCDFNKRLDTFRLVRSMSANNTLTIDTAAFVFHSCFFFLRSEKDLSIRDSTELCLKEVCPQLLLLVENDVGERQFLTETLLKAILGGIQGKDEQFKASMISLLGLLARECSASHFVFKDLALFTNKADMEVDFFENIHHLQLYRRNRALLKMVAIIKSLKEPINIRTVTQFLMPLANQFLCCETYAGKNSLVDAAIECVGVVCRLLPWYQYQSVLKHYLIKLRTQVEYQRQCVRLVIAILDAFHFDISRASESQNPPAVATPISAENEPKLIDVPTTDDFVTEVVSTVLDKDPFESTEAIVADILDEILDEVIANSLMGDEAIETVDDKLLVETITVLKPAVASRVHRALSGHLLEELYKAIGQRTAMEKSHKVNHKSLGPDKDEEDVLRVPIAVTLVKLLQKLPGDLLDTQLPGILTKLCTFLKSHLESVRRVTRETLQQIMIALGPSRLPLLLRELTGLLTKGFQVHVLIFTIHCVIQSLQPLLTPGDIDACLPTILQVCSADLFGSASEEKEVIRIKVKHKEVRSNKSFNLLHLVSQFVTEKCLTDLILPIKQALSTRNSHKMITKCRECLRQIVLGLAMNKFIAIEDLFIFLYGASSESIPQLKPTPPPPPKKHNPKERQDCLLLAPTHNSRMSSAPVKNSSRSGAHVIVEFGLHLLMILLKQDKIKKLKVDSYLDPIVPLLKSALESQHVKVSTLAVKCLSRMAQFDLPSLREHIKPITASLFASLHKFAAAGLTKGDNFDLVLAVFKMVSVIVRDVSYYTLTQEQLHALLLYAEQDIHDSSRQAVAFGVIKAVLHRKLNAPELHSVLEKVARLSVTHDMEHVRAQSRQTVLQYIMDYPLKGKLTELLAFFIAQLGYDEESGRQSSLEMIFSLIKAFPQNELKEQSGLFFLSLGARLINDESPACKKMVSAVIKGMLMKLSEKSKDDLFDMLLVWLRQKKLIHRRLSVQLAGIFVTLEKEEFAGRLEGLLPLIVKQLTGDKKPGKFVKPSDVVKNEESLLDHHLYLVFVLLVKISVHCPALLLNEEYRQQVALLADTAQNLLCHEHEWVRVGATQFLGSVLNAVKPDQMAAALKREVEADIRFWEPSNFSAKFKSLILDHTAQFVPGVELTQDFLDQLMKNLVYFAKVLKDCQEKRIVKKRKAPDDEDANEMNGVDDEGDERNQVLSFIWLVKRMRRIVNLEVARTPGTHTLRSAVFMWIGAVAVCLTKEEILPVLYHLAAPIVREAEVTQGETGENSLAVLVTEVRNKLKKKVGVDEFAECAVKLQSKLMEKRAKRKTAQAQEFVIDPENAVKRKLERHVKKKESKKRKREILHGKKPGKFKNKKRKME